MAGNAPFPRGLSHLSSANTCGCGGSLFWSDPDSASWLLGFHYCVYLVTDESDVTPFCSGFSPLLNVFISKLENIWCRFANLNAAKWLLIKAQLALQTDQIHWLTDYWPAVYQQNTTRKNPILFCFFNPNYLFIHHCFILTLFSFTIVFILNIFWFYSGYNLVFIWRK